MSDVFFTTMRTKEGEGLAHKLGRLVRAAGIEKIDFTNKFVAIKLHFGEPGIWPFFVHSTLPRLCKLSSL